MASSTVSTSLNNCSVCQELPKEPQLLPCNHTVCTHCLQQYMASGSRKQPVECPSCYKAPTQPKEVVKTLPRVQDEGANTFQRLCQSLRECPEIGSVRLGERKHHISLQSYDGTDVCGLVVIEGCVCIIRRFENTMYMYKPTRGSKTTKVPHCSSLRGMSLLSSSDGLVVLLDSEQEQTKLHYVEISIEDLSITHLRVTDVPLSKPSSISLSEQSEELIIGLEESQFAICTPDGVVKTKATVAPSDDRKTDSVQNPGDVHSPIAWKPTCVINDKDIYLVAKTESTAHGPRFSELQWVDHDGKQTDAPGNKRKIICGPHMIHDKAGRVIATDMEQNRLIIMSSNQHDLVSKYLSLDTNIMEPHFLYIADNLLYIAHKERGPYHYSEKSSVVSAFELCCSVSQKRPENFQEADYKSDSCFVVERRKKERR